MACVKKGLVPVLMGVRITGRGRGVTVSMKYCKNVMRQIGAVKD